MTAQRISREISTDCTDCRSAKLCRAKGEMCRVAALAWAHGTEAPTCPFHAPAWERGVEGVLPSSPRPFCGLRAGGQR